MSYTKYTFDSPYEIAVRETEERTKILRSAWEHIIGHPLVRETDQRARQIAGIREDRPPTRRMNHRRLPHD